MMSTCDKVIGSTYESTIYFIKTAMFFIQNINSIGFELDVNESTKVTKKQVISNEFNRLICC